MRRVRFPSGEQRAFLKSVIEESGAPSLRSLAQFGIETPYSTLKNYFIEDRHLSEELFVDLCYLAGFDVRDFAVEYLEEHFGQVRGGKKSRRSSK